MAKALAKLFKKVRQTPLGMKNRMSTYATKNI